MKLGLNPFEEVREEYAKLLARKNLKKATFAGGCFWCMEGPFEAMEGVAGAVVGYAGGTVKKPTYDQELSGTTGHREAVQVFYDPKRVTFAKLLETYWWQVDPTDEGGQFADRGETYTTAVFYETEGERREIERQIEELNKSGRYEKPIVTQVLLYTTFYPAEDYHQQFYQKRSEYYARYKKGSGRQDYLEAMKEKYGTSRELLNPFGG